ncbi:hypothetical protein MMC22_010193 [Lobaria immixta]|nr:hypothetical protein [Lobaria immixta]
MLRLSLTPLGLLLFATILPLASSHPQINTQIPSTTNNFTTTAFFQTKSTTTYSPSTISITLHTSSNSNSPLTTTTRPTANSTTTTTPRTTPDEATRPINTDSEPYPDSKRSSNYCACGSLVDDGFTIKSACFPVRAQCCSWCCREDIEGYANICRTSGLEDPNCPGEGPDARPVDGSLAEPVVANVEGSGVDEEGGGS